MSEVSPGHRPKQTKAQKSAAKKAKRDELDPTKTGRALRQTFTTPSVADLMVQLSEVEGATPANGPNAEGEDDTHAVFAEFHTTFADRDVDAVFDAVRQSKVVEFIEHRVESRKDKAGRPLP